MSLDRRSRFLCEKIRQGRKVVGAAVGSGLSAVAAESGGADFVMVLNAGEFRVQGCSSVAALMPYGDANSDTWELARTSILPRLSRTPTFVGFCAHDPQIEWEETWGRLSDHKTAGVTNFPSVGFFDGQYREALEEEGFGYDNEVEMLKRAKDFGLLAIGFCFDEDQALSLVEAGVDIVSFITGFSSSRDRSSRERQEALDSATHRIREVVNRARQIDENAFITVFGDPILFPADAEQIFQQVDINGYIGGSVIEKFTTEPVIAQTIREFQLAVQATGNDRLGSLIGRSPSMQQLFERVRQVAQSPAPVLIVGESGTGKELIAREIHRLSDRSQNPLVCWNCGATSESLAMSELFGHEKGAFTGADQRRLGRFESADQATLFMDEIGDLPLSVQASLLRVVQEKEVVRVGGQSSLPINTRIIAASNKDFAELIRDRAFRLDLYYRLNTFVLRSPPLRERPDDIPLLVREFSNEFSLQYGQSAPALSTSVMNLLQNHYWPGNVRQLKNVIEQGFVLGKGSRYQKSWIEEALEMDALLYEEVPDVGPSMVVDLPNETFAQKRARLLDTLDEADGNKTEAARRLGVSRKTLYQWLKRN
jgi:DNA-binding NtrC family response regulator/predicted TIM-barrel enzyme